ncbi:hypothetical protein SLEP1_g30586 [Rubroshorea leprosula]|uniref:Endonuclease/exonuclease/phosphatase domain-containing protein n=1 Tax=Rubroshorea leprosula TaxID=152421 RepID=A0AAV5K8Z4_9ROSI|nr:hypothetical protein SLEP1_g30586 [Rubroshorea leprosula]
MHSVGNKGTQLCQPITAQAEEKDGGTAQPSWMLRGFNEAVETCGLTEVHMVGGSFTWRRKILEKLDRGLASASWKGLFSRAKIQLLPPLSSDHNPLWLVLDGRKERMNSHRKRFRFEEMWLRDTGCYEVVRTGWQSIEREGSWSCLLQKVRECSKGLELWNSKQFGHVQQRLKQCSKRLQNLQNQVCSEATSLVEKGILDETEEWLEGEEIMELNRWLKEKRKKRKKQTERKEKRNVVTESLDRSYVGGEGPRRIMICGTKVGGENGSRQVKTSEVG